MGLRNWLHNKHMSDPVDGTLQLTSCSVSTAGAAYSNCRMQGVVSAPGIEPVAVEHLCTAPTKKWPQPGQTIPVRVDRTDPSRLEVRWDDMPTGHELGRQLAQQQAQQLAAQMSSGAWDQNSSETWGQSSPGASGQHGASGQPGASGQTPSTAGYPAGVIPATLQSALDAFTRAVQAGGATVTCNMDVVGNPGRPLPGMSGGGLTPEQAAAAVSGIRAAAGMQQATARVLAVHEVPIPAGLPGGGPAGTVDLTLDIELPAGGGYSTTMRIGFSTPEKRARIAAVGQVLPVLVNPAARDQVAIDTGRLG